ncbi:MAG TPA: hypothetical protein VFI06_13890 [Chitinophagaceae bacterium]|nr:hypothetical protein [Chitinophagaceae bacterium]
MTSKILKFLCIPIYLFYAYLFVWQITYINDETFLNRGLGETLDNFFRYLPAIVLLLYAVLLYCNIILKQPRILILNSLFAASLLYMHATTPSLVIALLLSIFGLVIAGFEIKQGYR